MKLTKERGKKPVIENGHGTANVRYSDGQWVFTIDCHGAWVQGKGYESSYTLHLSKLEMLSAVHTWLDSLLRDEVEAFKKAKTIG